MPAYICTACGQQQPDSPAPPAACPICTDGRQYVPAAGQNWTTPAALARRHLGTWRLHEPGLLGFGMQPHFAIGQRALLVDTGAGWVMWDCVPLLDDATLALLRALGGLRAIAISHPHYYATCVDWSRAFGGIPVYAHAADRAWVQRLDPCMVHWTGDSHALAPGLTLVRAGGHFDGAAVLHWTAADGAGVLLTADTLQVGPDGQLGFMRSYPNMVPLAAPAVDAIEAALAPYAYDRLYGAFFDRAVPANAQAVVARSAARHRAALRGEYQPV